MVSCVYESFYSAVYIIRSVNTCTYQLQINTLRFLVVRACVAVTNLRLVCKTITCVSAFTEMIIFLEIVKAATGLDTALQATRRMPLWALAIALATGKNTKLFGVLDQNENGFFTYVSQRAGSKAATVVTND